MIAARPIDPDKEPMKLKSTKPLLVLISGPPLPGRGDLTRAVAQKRAPRVVRVRDGALAEDEIRASLSAGEEVVVEGEFPTRAERASVLALGGRAALVSFQATREEATRSVLGRYAGRPDFMDQQDLQAFEDDLYRREPPKDEIAAETLLVIPAAAPLPDQVSAVEQLLDRLAPLPAHARRRDPTPPRPTLRRVLAVDDDADTRDALTAVLSELGYHVETLPTGEAALERLAMCGAPSVDMVVADHRMPGISGTDLIAAIHESYPDVRTMLLTGYGDDQTCAEALRAQAATVLAKPLRVIDLQRALDEALG